MNVGTACLALFCVFAAGRGLPVAAQGKPPLTIDVKARAFTPGELIVMTLGMADGGERIQRVRISVFKRDTLAFKLADGRWQALIGIDLDQQPGRYVATVDADVGDRSVRYTHAIAVQSRAFRTRTLKVAPNFVNPSPDQMSRITGEAAFLRNVYASPAATRLWSAPFVRPVPDAANSLFGTRSVFNGERRSPHGGTDFMSPAGRPIKAPNAGRIVCARDLFFTGNTVIVDHGLGVFSLLAHLSRMDVSEGQPIQDGEIVGLVGATGRVTGPHLHWALTVWGARVDPMSLLTLLGPKPSSL